MSFRKRNVRLSNPEPSKETHEPTTTAPSVSPGTRPSPLDGRPTTSTGTKTLDDLLAGHTGLPLGHSILIEENGTTDFAGALLRYYAAEGVVQGHHVHVVGMPERWGRDLPGLIEEQAIHKESHQPAENVANEKMKIAWRYERMGEFGASSRGGIALTPPNVINRPNFLVCSTSTFQSLTDTRHSSTFTTKSSPREPSIERLPISYTVDFLPRIRPHEASHPHP